jgi:hypothetical protein
MHRLVTPGLLFLFFICFLRPHPAEARLNLPQVRQVVQLGGAARAAAWKYFSRSRTAGELPALLQDTLLQSMPENFRNDCGSLMEEWAGERGRDSGIWAVRLLDLQGARAWLAFGCGSRLKDEDMARYHDERLALLHLDTGALELLPLDADSQENEGVYQFEFAKSLALENATGFCFRVTIDNNPCCDGPEYRSQKRLMVFVDTPQGALESLSVVTARDDSSHSDDPEVDTETTYHAELEFERDMHNHATAVNATFHETAIDTTWESGKANHHTVSERSGTQRFRWNPTTFKFEEVR